MSVFKRLVLVTLTLSTLSGCDLVDGDSGIDVTGTNLNESAGAPARGLSVVLKRSAGLGINIVVASDRTDASGRFRLQHDPEEGRNGLRLYVNEEPYNAAYSTANYGIEAGERSDRTIGIYQNATLTVHAVTDVPLSGDDSYYLWLPTSGARSQSVTDTRARGNAYNKVRLVVSRDGVTSEVVDSVYCPVGVVTDHTVRY
jgi:5-hydroxyisourate hydrolase-like protein (transthyretin family)